MWHKKTVIALIATVPAILIAMFFVFHNSNENYEESTFYVQNMHGEAHNFFNPLMVVNAHQNTLAFRIEGEYGNYYFVYADWWTEERAFAYVSIAEQAIQFTLDWLMLDAETYAPITVVFHAGDTRRFSRHINHIVHICADYHNMEGAGSRIVQELVWMLYEGKNVNTEGTSHFLRALASAARVLYNDKFWSEDFTVYQFNYTIRPLLTGASEVIGRDLIFYFNQRNGERIVHHQALADSLSLMTIDMLPLMDERINYSFDYVTYAQLYAHNAQHGFMYTLTVSFFHYLLNLDTRENFLRAYADIYLIEEIYGKDLEGMFRQWLEHIRY